MSEEPPRTYDRGSPGEEDIAPDVAAAPSAVALSPQNARSVWQQVVTELGGLLAAHALQCDRVTLSGDGLLVAFRESRQANREYCEAPLQRARLIEKLASLTAATARIAFETVADPVEEQAAPTKPRQAALSKERLMQERSQHPLVRRAVELFDAKPLAVEGPEGG